MVDWSKYDDEAKAAVQAEEESAREVVAISRAHAERLIAANVPNVSRADEGEPLWHIDNLQHDGVALGTYSLGRNGCWYRTYSTTYLEDDFTMRHKVEKQRWATTRTAPPILDGEALARELAKDYHRRMTGQ